MPNTICSENQVGPINIWLEENRVASIQSIENGQKEYFLSSGCINGTYSNGVIKTNYLEVKGAPVKAGFWDYLWNKKAPASTAPEFDFLYTAYILQKFIEDLSSIKVYEEGLPNVLLKSPISIDVSLTTFANAAFSPAKYGIFFGMVANQCSFGADGDVIIHEFTHLLTFSNNPFLGFVFTDIEGQAIHEALSDISAAVYFNDPEIAESMPLCLKKVAQESKEVGLRNVGDKQLKLDIEKEPHYRSLYYSPYLWTCYETLLKYFNGNKIIARNLMLTLLNNIPEFLPSNPKKSELVKAFYNSLADVTSRNTFHFRYISGDKANFFKKEFADTIAAEGLAFHLITASDQLSDILKLYPYVDKNSIADIIKNLSSNDLSFALEINKGRQSFYQQYYKGFRVIGAGIRFVNTANGIQMIEMIQKPDGFKTDKKISKNDAVKILNSAKAVSEVQNLLLNQVKNGTMENRDVAYTINNFVQAKKTINPKEVFIPGKSNIQYAFELKGIITCYIDSADGSISLATQTFF